jgi:hypothetical protein
LARPSANSTPPEKPKTGTCFFSATFTNTSPDPFGFPEYEAYAGQVPALWPRLTAAPLAVGARFRWPLYRKNQEYQAARGFAAGMLFLLWKALR